MVQERDQEAQAVIRILVQLDKKWNNLRLKIEKCSMVNMKVRMRSSEDVEKGKFDERVSKVIYLIKLYLMSFLHVRSLLE